MQTNELIKCPECNSPEIHINKRGFKVGRAIVGGILTGNLFAATIAGGIGMNKIELTCSKCGHKFYIDKAKHLVKNKASNVLPKGVNVSEIEYVNYRYECPICHKSYNGELHHCPKCGRKFLEENKITISNTNSNKKGCTSMILLFFILFGLLSIFTLGL